MQNLEFKGVEHFRIDKIIYFSHQTNLNHAIFIVLWLDQNYFCVCISLRLNKYKPKLNKAYPPRVSPN